MKARCRWTKLKGRVLPDLTVKGSHGLRRKTGKGSGVAGAFSRGGGWRYAVAEADVVEDEVDEDALAEVAGFSEADFLMSMPPLK